MASEGRVASPAGSAFAWLGAALFARLAGLVRVQLFRPLSGAGSERRPRRSAGLGRRALHRVCGAPLALRPRCRSCVGRADLPRPRALRLRVGGERPVRRRCAARGARVPGTAWTVEGARRVAAVRGASRRHRADAARRGHPGRVGTGRHAAAAPRARRAGGDATFTRRGPYGWVRHPIYSGWFLVVFAVPVDDRHAARLCRRQQRVPVDRHGVRGALARPRRAPRRTGSTGGR